MPKNNAISLNPPPQQQPAKHYGRNGFQYKQQYGVVVLCESERHQQQVYAALKEQDLKLKVVSV